MILSRNASKQEENSIYFYKNGLQKRRIVPTGISFFGRAYLICTLISSQFITNKGFREIIKSLLIIDIRKKNSTDYYLQIFLRLFPSYEHINFYIFQSKCNLFMTIKKETITIGVTCQALILLQFYVSSTFMVFLICTKIHKKYPTIEFLQL